MKTLTELSEQLRQRRKAQSLSQKDMLLKIGMSQQQYQRIESAGDMRVSTLFRILEGLDLELILASTEQARELKNRVAGNGHMTTEGKTEGNSSASLSWDSVLAELQDSEQ